MKIKTNSFYEKLKIAIIRTTLNKGSGQVRVIREISKRLYEKGHKIQIFTREKKEAIPFSIQIPVFANSVPLVRGITFGFKCGLSLKNYDIVHTQYHPDIFTGNIAKKILGIPHVSHFHGFASIRIWKDPKQKVKMIDHRLGSLFSFHLGIDHFLPVSNYLKNELIHFYGVPETKITVIYNGIDSKRFSPQNSGEDIRKRYKIGKNPVILYLGRLTTYKGFHFLLKAVPIIKRQIPNIKIIIAGSPRSDIPNFNALISKLGIAKSIIFTGYVTDNLLPNLYASCDIFCFPSLWEGFGLPPAEANASGKPVVAFNKCAIPEVVKHKKTGLLVPPGNVNKLANALIYLLENEELRVKMGINGRKHIESNFNWEKAVQKILKIYELVLEKK